MGGSDVNGVTERLARVLKKADEGFDEIHIVLGPAFRREPDTKIFEDSGGIVFHRSPESLGPLMCRVDLVITSAGLTLYEAIRQGLPALSIPQNEFELETARILEERRGCVNMGLGTTVDPKEIISFARSLLKDRGRLRDMSRAAKGIGVGDGRERLRNEIARHLKNMS